MCPKKVYTEEQHEFINSNHKGISVRELVELFNKEFNENKTYSQLKSYLSNHGMKTGAKRGLESKYTEEIIDFIRENVRRFTDKEIAQMVNDKWNLGINESSITNAKTRYGIKSGVRRGTFKKGDVPFNKGKTWDEFMSPEAQRRSMETTFRKGEFTHNRREIGEERFNSDGYWYVKVQDGQLNQNWKLKHHIFWEEANGPIPDDKIIIFLDGDTSNMELENMRMITRQVSVRMAQQKLYSNDRELTLAGSLTVEIDEKVKKLN